MIYHMDLGQYIANYKSHIFLFLDFYEQVSLELTKARHLPWVGCFASRWAKMAT